MNEEEFFNQVEAAYYASQQRTQAGAFGKLWAVIKGLTVKGANPLTLLAMVQWIMDLISQFNTLTVEELIEKILHSPLFSG